MRMTIMAIDPALGKPQAWALFRDRVLVEYGRANMDGLNHLIAGAEVVVCEGQYIGSPPKGNGPKMKAWRAKAEVAIPLARMTGRLEQKALDLGVRFEIVRPASWQTLLKVGRGRVKAELDRAAVAQAGVEIRAAGLEVPAKLNVDIAAAICLGVYYGGQEHQKQMQGAFFARRHNHKTYKRIAMRRKGVSA